MRFVLPGLLAFAVCGAALAQGAPRVTIEDDVAPANALKCAALRLAQSEVRPDPLVEAARDAWLRSGVDAAKARAEAAKVATGSPELIAALSDDCEPFEIRSAPPAGG
jgi:nucleoid-associated protein YgaU